MIKTYNPQSSHISSSVGGWINYIGASEKQFKLTREQIFKDYPNSVIVDGTDDWFSQESHRPQLFAEKFGLKILAYYHSGNSGMTKSGIVISSEDYYILQDKYTKAYNLNVESVCKIYIQG